MRLRKEELTGYEADVGETSSSIKLLQACSNKIPSFKSISHWQ
jgi:hypothetical protein